MLDTPLLGTEAQGWKGETRNMPLGYQKWIEAQPLSITALDKIATFKDTIYPISKVCTSYMSNVRLQLIFVLRPKTNLFSILCGSRSTR